MNKLTPNSHAKRSYIYHQQPAANYVEMNDAVLMDEVEPDESSHHAPCALMDLSNLTRCGLRGPATEQVLQQLDLPFPAQHNQCLSLAQGQTVVRLSKTECWVLGSLKQDNDWLQKLGEQTVNAKCYPLYCQDSHAWFVLMGDHLPEIMAKLCSVDLRGDNFPQGSVVQTSVARVNAIVLNHTMSGKEVFSILSDSASAGYLWHAVLDAMREFGGKAAGIRGL